MNIDFRTYWKIGFIWTISLQLASFSCHYKDTVSFNSAVWDPLFAECACYVGPPGQAKPNNYFDNIAVSQKDNADEGMLLCHS